MSESCVSDEEILELVEGRLSPGARTRVEAHLDTCDACLALVADAARLMDGASGRQAVGHEATLPQVELAQPALLPRGTTVNRYVILDPLGRGGMGVVYRAYDPEIDRRVALKLVRPGSQHLGELQKRLVREAQVMARVSHANVLTVYDAGVYGREVFITMELIDGGTLAQWCRAEKRSWRDVLARFVLAGRGLAAAHAAGLVHRDFKPDNVLIGNDGGVRVADFGLALPTSQSELGEPLLPSPASSIGRLTGSGARAGTPPYMSPEQLRSEALDARTDVFSFCVALYEALFGVRPFIGTNPESLLTAIETGRRAELARSEVPGWLRVAVERGLAAKPDDRHASMNALLTALRADRAPTRRRWLWAGVGAALLLGGGVYLQVSRSASRLCRGAERSFAHVWDAPKRAQIHGVFLATGAAQSEDTFARAARALDEYRARWENQWTEACEATRIRGAQSEQLLDLRMECLDDRLNDVRALTDILASADANVVNKAAQAAASLPLLAGCGDVKTLRQKTPLPSDSQALARADAIKRDLAHVRALAETGRYDESLAVAGTTLAAADALGYAPLIGEAELQRGQRLARLSHPAEAARALRRAVVTALSTHDRETAARAWMDLAFIISFQDKHPAEGRELAALAGALIHDLGRPDELEAEHERLQAQIDTLLNQPEEAEAHARRALALAERAFGADSPQLAQPLNELAIALQALGKFDESQATAERGVAVLERTVGAMHPDVGHVLHDMAALLNAEDRFGPSLAAAQRALVIKVATLGADSPETNDTRGLIIDDLVALGRFAEAIPLAQTALRYDANDWRQRGAWPALSSSSWAAPKSPPVGAATVWRSSNARLSSAAPNQDRPGDSTWTS